MNRKKEINNIIEKMEEYRENWKIGLMTNEEYVERVKKECERLVYFDMALAEKLDKQEEEKVMQK